MIRMHFETKVTGLVEYYVFATRRSGHHGFINWLMPIVGTRVHINDSGSVAPIIHLKEGCRTLEKASKAIADSKLKNLMEDKIVVVSFEDWKPERFALQMSKHQPDPVTQILFIRDPFNCFASRYKHKAVMPRDARPETFEQVRELWKLHAQTYLGKSEFVIRAKYTNWYTDQDYRKSLADQLKRPFTDEGFGILAKQGQGSSFSKAKIQDTSQLGVLERWKYFVDNEKYLSMFDQEILELSEQIFGITEAHEELHKRISTRK